jgi:hypothetical protein
MKNSLGEGLNKAREELEIHKKTFDSRPETKVTELLTSFGEAVCRETKPDVDSGLFRIVQPSYTELRSRLQKTKIEFITTGDEATKLSPMAFWKTAESLTTLNGKNPGICNAESRTNLAWRSHTFPSRKPGFWVAFRNSAKSYPDTCEPLP